MSDQSAIQKFRPVLSASELSHIITLCKRDGSKDSLSVLSKLVMYEYKIQNAVITPAYSAPERQPLSVSLGFEDSTQTHNHATISPEALYNLWLQEPASLTITQLSAVREWRYQHDKMTVDEEKAFEKEVLGLEI